MIFKLKTEPKQALVKHKTPPKCYYCGQVIKNGEKYMRFWKYKIGFFNICRQCLFDNYSDEELEKKGWLKYLL